MIEATGILLDSNSKTFYVAHVKSSVEQLEE